MEFHTVLLVCYNSNQMPLIVIIKESAIVQSMVVPFIKYSWYTRDTIDQWTSNISRISEIEYFINLSCPDLSSNNSHHFAISSLTSLPTRCQSTGVSISMTSRLSGCNYLNILPFHHFWHVSVYLMSTITGRTCLDYHTSMTLLNCI